MKNPYFGIIQTIKVTKTGFFLHKFHQIDVIKLFVHHIIGGRGTRGPLISQKW